MDTEPASWITKKGILQNYFAHPSTLSAFQNEWNAETKPQKKPVELDFADGDKLIAYFKTATAERVHLFEFMLRSGKFPDKLTRTQLQQLLGESAKAGAVSMHLLPTTTTIKVLLLSASPTGVGPVRLDESMRAIQSSLVRIGPEAERIHLIADYAATRGELIDRLRSHKPHIVQFLAHMGQAGIMLRDDDSQAPVIIPANGIKALFGHAITEGKVRCVVLTGCSSADISNALKDVVPFTVGTTLGIDNPYAAQFAARFYNSLARGDTLGNAVATAKAQLAIYGFDDTAITSTGAPDSRV